MKKLLGAISVLAAATVAFLAAPKAHAQLVTFETLTSYNGAGIIGFTNGSTALTQTFNNILELQSITFRFTTTSGTSSTVAQSFSAYLVQWNPGSSTVSSTFSTPVAANSSTDSSVTEPTVAAQTFTVPPVGTGAWATDNFSASAGGGSYSGYDVQLNLNQYTDPTLTYAVVLVDNTSASGLGLLDVTGSSANVCQILPQLVTSRPTLALSDLLGRTARVTTASPRSWWSRPATWFRFRSPAPPPQSSARCSSPPSSVAS